MISSDLKVSQAAVMMTDFPSCNNLFLATFGSIEKCKKALLEDFAEEADSQKCENNAEAENRQTDSETSGQSCFWKQQ